MSDLGRASNGGARAGPVPVAAARSGVIPPTEIMRRRNERRAQAALEQARDEELRRQQAEQSGQGSTPTAGGATQPSGYQDQQYNQPSIRRPRPQSESDARIKTRPMSEPKPPQVNPQQSNLQQTNPPQSTSRVSYDPPPATNRQRAATQSSGQPRPAPTAATAGPSGTQGRTNPAQPGLVESRIETDAQWNRLAGAGGDPSEQAYEQETPPSQRVPARVGFPHAFQRWEDLSAKWEGLTGYWLRKMEQTQDETRSQPLNTQLSRQITDLSAAGANLFHALVELQRLRASSERKFQRWFFETRKNEERTQEISAQLERALVEERQARADDIATWEAKVEQAKRTESNASKLVGEMRRELEISKGESRRAWEELGRREEEERERVAALKNGEAIVVGGYTVHPKAFQDSVQDSMSQRPVTRDGPTQAAAQPDYQDEASPTNTDPFTEMRGQQAPSGADQNAWVYQSRKAQDATDDAAFDAQSANVSSLSQGLPMSTYEPRSSVPATTSDSGAGPSTYRPAGAPTQARIIGYQNGQPIYEPQRSLYSHQNTHLHPNAPASIASPTATYATHTNTDEYGSEQEEGYEMDEQGKLVLDATGQPIPYRRGLHRLNSQSGDSEDSDVEREATNSAAVEEYARLEHGAGSSQREQAAREEIEREQMAWEQEQTRHHQRMAHLASQITSPASSGAVPTSSTAVSYPAVPASSSTNAPYAFLSTPSPPPTSMRTSTSMNQAPAPAAVPPRAFFGTPSPPSSPSAMRTSGSPAVSSAPALPPPPADYTGAGYGSRWVHHEPTRLSDVMEEGEEETRSRVSSRNLGLGRTSGAPF